MGNSKEHLEYIDFNKLRAVIASDSSDTKNAIESSDCTANISNVLKNIEIRLLSLHEDECAMAIMSLNGWVVRKTFSNCRVPVNIGDIFYTNLGLPNDPEFAYPHPVLVTEKIGNLYLIIPTTTSPQKIQKAYHPNSNITGNKFMRLVYGNDTDHSDGFERTCALLLSNFRTISGGRFIGKKGHITNNQILDDIKATMFKYVFPRYYIKLRKLQTNTD